MAVKGLHTHTHITHPVRCVIYNLNDGLPHTSAASVSDNQTCQIIQKEEKNESESPYALHVISALSRRVNMKMSLERDTTGRRLSIWSYLVKY